MKLELYNLKDLPSTAQQIIQFAGETKIWLFEGSMAAGKTTLIQAIVKELGVNESTGSPTYSLVNEYLTENGQTIYHFDFYRLKSEIEALDYGVDEYFDSGNICLCEWPSMIPNLWPSKYLMLNLNVLEDGSREILAEKFG
ncbi:MAG: tRNA (adenosine(37)-N6)-threonylcarbamoyltransferase complex ATPase subunit type 1 TsaE [Bacteroidota bacterium]